MKIDGTEFECTESDCVALDYFLGGQAENKDEWAKRVWDKCIEYKSTKGLGKVGFGYGGERMSRVYSNDPHFLWEQKKRRRRIALYRELKGKSIDENLSEDLKVKNDLENKINAEWSFDLQDAQILELKNDINYKTRTQRENEIEAEFQVEQKKMQEERIAKVSKLREKFDDETIAIIYPQGAALL